MTRNLSGASTPLWEIDINLYSRYEYLYRDFAASKSRKFPRGDFYRKESEGFYDGRFVIIFDSPQCSSEERRRRLLFI